VISIGPESGYTLKGLGLYLKKLEQKKREWQDVRNEGPPRYQDVDEERNLLVDPLFSSSDPWYDGRGHNYTIVDAPRKGSLLSPDRSIKLLSSRDG